LFALGLENEVVGVTSYCDYPPRVLERVAVGQIAVVGGYVNPEPERIISLDPDLILASTNLQLKLISFLQERGLIVAGLDPKDVNGIVTDILLVGKRALSPRCDQTLLCNQDLTTTSMACASCSLQLSGDAWS